MIAIAESGSTKCEWVILDESGTRIANFKTQGFNPYFHSSEFVANTLAGISELEEYRFAISHLYFYGAGCSSDVLNGIIEKGLSKVFQNAEITVEHDLLAAAYSLYEGEPLVCGILGTGSNSTYFDGEKLVDLLPSLGFVLGDEGSGGYFGKKLISDFFYKKLPSKMQADFAKTYNLSWGEAVAKIYGGNHPNVFVASFMPFLARHREEEYVVNTIHEGFGKFIDIHVNCYAAHGVKKVGFVGTIAYEFRDILEAELNFRGFEAGRILRNPVKNLVEYHLKYSALIPVK